MIDKALVKDCLDWFRDVPGLNPPPDADRLRIMDQHPDAVIPQDEPVTMPVSRQRLVWALLYALALGAALLLPLHLALDWYSPLSFLLLLAIFAVCYGFPVALAVSQERLAVPEPDIHAGFGPAAGPAAVVRALALARYNSSRAREFWHACLDMLLFPLFLSCQESVAAWAARRYCADRDLEYRANGLRARLSVPPLLLLEKIKGPKAVGWLIRTL